MSAFFVLVLRIVLALTRVLMEVALMKNVLMVIGFMVVWVVLNRWVLPRFGVQT